MHEGVLVESSATKAATLIEVAPGIALIRDGHKDELVLNGTTLVTIEGAPASGEKASAACWTISSMVVAKSATHEQVCFALYQSLRRGRIARKTVVSVSPGVLSPELLTLIQATPSRVAGHMAARLDIALSKLAQTFEPVIRASAMYYVQEVADTVRAHVEAAFQEGFFQAVVDAKLTKEQYIYILTQQHAYVRYTTRILGYCVAYAQDSNLRRHFAKHLTEEVNHEKILEADLAYLSADVDYVVRDLEANPSTMQFVLGELALVSHFHDPVLLTAAPLVAEGISGHLGSGFVQRLEAIVRSWGYAEPQRATRFFSSHIEYDGGEEGHFQGSMQMLSAHLTNERELRRYLAAVHGLGECFLRIYSESMRETDVWG
jgi:hypothetical protein